MSPLDWDLGHIAAYEDLWLVHRHGGEPLLRGDLADLYDAFETPRAVRGDIELLARRRRLAYLAAVRRARSRSSTRWPRRRSLLEMVIRHEAQHNETMRQTLFLGGLLGAAAGRTRAALGAGVDRGPGGRVRDGRRGRGFAFDNERPRHQVSCPPSRSRGGP